MSFCVLHSNNYHAEQCHARVFYVKVHFQREFLAGWDTFFHLLIHAKLLNLARDRSRVATPERRMCPNDRSRAGSHTPITALGPCHKRLSFVERDMRQTVKGNTPVSHQTIKRPQACKVQRRRELSSTIGLTTAAVWQSYYVLDGHSLVLSGCYCVITYLGV